MWRRLRRFVGKIDKMNHSILVIVLILICVVALSLGVYVQFFYKYSDTDPFMIGINIGAKKTAEEYELLKSNFNDLFQNELKVNSENLKVDKINAESPIVYTGYDLVNEDETYYSVDAQVPIINIDTDKVEKINAEIKTEYYNKANSIMRQTQGNTIYKVSYAAFINADYLSIAIKSSLKEEGKPEQVQVKTYTYSFSQDEMISLEDLIELKSTTAQAIQKTIDDEIQKSYQNAKIIESEYGSFYERDLTSDIYKLENTDVYFLTDDGYVYIVYAYGNTDDTNEMDIIIF